MQKRKVIVVLLTATLAVCVASTFGYMSGLREKERTWCRNYIGTESLSRCRDIAPSFGPM